jgi:thiol-disulfide isomerase/thioredoxin
MNGMKGVIANQEGENPGEITVFTAEWCGACKRRVPQILKKAQAAGLRVKLIDVDDADPKYRKMLRRVKFVPHIDYMGHEIYEDELDLVCQKTKAGVK